MVEGGGAIISCCIASQLDQRSERCQPSTCRQLVQRCDNVGYRCVSIFTHWVHPIYEVEINKYDAPDDVSANIDTDTDKDLF